MRFRLNWLSLTLSIFALVALALPVVSVRQSRISLAEPRSLTETFGAGGWAVALSVLAVSAALLFVQRPRLRLALICLASPGLLLLAGLGAREAAVGLGPYARVAPGAAVWVWLAVMIVAFSDALTRPGLGGWHRSLATFFVLGAAAAIFVAGLIDPLSVVVEYRARADSFQQELKTHILLALGSFGLAFALGFPLGLWLEKRPTARGPVLSILTGVQTVPSIAMFGLMIVPLGWLAAHVPGAAAIGASGIGFAPAFLALLLYSLLPVLANTLAGVQSVAPEVDEAARAMGMDDRQRRWLVTLPLAAPVILLGARVVLVQNIGLATVGALIGAGGLGTYVFQGLAQGAMDLVLLGALPTVFLAIAFAALLDTIIMAIQGGRG